MFWQQPSILARTYDVPLWSEQHFCLLEEMAASLAKIGQKAITVIAGEIPGKVGLIISSKTILRISMSIQ